MAIEAGTRLGNYEVLSSLGAGGMGEVYRARDMKLGREVAIKVLPEGFSDEPERMARFEREAKVLASLNHNNIATLYGFESDADTQFLVMEVVEGETLAERLERGSMPLDEAIPVALQIAEALEEAHEKGIVHRDLKPQNIKLTPEGKVKVLDFGLAKALDPEAPSSVSAPQLTHSPTLTLGATVEGVVLGTAAYMAPEQAKGQVADKRADIWAFGVVLWEMLSGRRLFSAETAPETLARVLMYEPDLEALPATLPPGIRRLLRRCLQRDPRNRLRDIGDAQWELLDTDPELIEYTGTGDAGQKKVWVPWIVAAVGVLAAVLAWTQSGAPPATSESDGIFKVRYATLEVEEGGSSRPFFLAPQGDRVVIEAPGELLIRHRRGLEPTVLVEDLVGARSTPFWSPDGRWVAYESGGKLWKVPADGGAPKRICSVPNNFNAGAWGADNRIVFVVTRGDMFSVSAQGGNPQVLLSRVAGEDIDFHQPTFLPDGRSLVYSVHRPSGVDTIEVLTAGERLPVYRLEGELRLSPQVLNVPIYSVTGHLVYRRDAGDVGVWALPFSLDEMKVTGDPFLAAAGARWPSVSSDGRRLAYAEASRDSLSRLVRVAIDGSSSAPIVGGGIAGIGPATISPAGDRIAFGAEVGSGRELFVTDLRGQRSRLTSTPESEDVPVWSPDGATLLFERGTGEGTAIYRMPVDGSSAPEKIVDQASSPTLSAVGRRLVFATNSRSILGVGYYDFKANVETILLESASDFANPQLSPNGRVLAYTGWETGGGALSFRAFPEGATSQTVPDTDDTYFAWSPDSRTLYYWHSVEPKIMAVDVVSEPTVVVSPPRIALDLEVVGLSAPLQNLLAVFPDGKDFLIAQSMDPGEGLGDIVLVENWLDELEATFAGTTK